MSSETIRRQLVIHGRVQGVFFRDSLRQVAEREGVAGWAANREDGAVEVVLEGPPDAVGRVAEFGREGPERARVESVDEQEGAPEGLQGFRIR